MPRVHPGLVVLAAILAAAPVLTARELRPATLAAFDRYVQLTEARIQSEQTGASPYLWIDQQPAADRAALVDRLRRGEVIVTRLETRDGKKSIDVDHGLIHHWMGSVLFPGVPLDRALRFVQGYDAYGDVFGPMIQRSKLLSHTGDRFTYTMRMWTKKVITVVLDAAYTADYRSLSASRAFVRTVTTDIQEVHEAGKPAETRKPSEQGAGFMWRLNTYCSFDVRSEGTFEQCESITLTRDVPFGLGWIIKPFVTAIPREAIEFTLGRARAALSKPGS